MSNALKSSIRASAAIVLGVAAVSFASSASACGEDAVALHASWQADQGAYLQKASEDSPGNHAIVGMWSFNMTAGAFSDFGYQQWHSDGTELMNSGGRAPATQNFCMGVWKQTAPSRYHLNHFALSYDSSGVLNAKVNIKEDVTVDASGTTYSGSFTLDVYDPHTNAVLQHLAGRVTARRVPAN